MHPHRNERGFSLLIVLMAILVMSISGAAAVSIGGADNTAAASRSARAQARFAAESGLVGFFDANPVETLADERVDPTNGNYASNAGRAPVEINSTVIDGTTYRLEHVWWGTGTNPAATGELDSLGAGVIIEGRMLQQRGGSPEAVMARVWLGTVTRKCEGAAGAGQKGGADGTNVIDERIPDCPYAPRAGAL